MPVQRALSMFDTIVSPVALYGSEVWAPLVLPVKSFRDIDSVLRAWENFKPEILNQKVCRMLLGVHRKAARYAVLGELGRFPLLFRALSHTLKYEWHVSNKTPLSSLVSQALTEMRAMSDSNVDCWYNRVAKLKTLFNVPMFNNGTNPDLVGKRVQKLIESKFSIFWKREINRVKLVPGSNSDHNKLRFYNTLKSSFTIEPYLTLVENRNQRSWLSRIRISAHRLRIEIGRYTQPVTPVSERLCLYCSSDSIDNEVHLLACPTFHTKINCLYGKMSAVDSDFHNLPIEQKIVSLLCPAKTKPAKLFNKFIGIIFSARNRIDKGEPMDLAFVTNNFFESDSDDSDQE